jgi:ADP-ribosylglycohydrolase
VNTIGIKTRNAMMGLAIGDALGWSAMYHRSFLLPPWTRRLRRDIEAESENSGTIGQTLPFSLNRDSSAFLLGPTDDSEWAAFTASLLLENRGTIIPDTLVRKWKELAETQDFLRGKASVKGALKNLSMGLLPPVTGHDHPGYYDDAAVGRAVPIGVACVGNPYEAARLANLEASVTNAEDGIYAAEAMSVAVALACSGSSLREVIDASVRQLPVGSWIRRNVDSVLSRAVKSASLVSAVAELSEHVVNREYNSGTAAPETFAMTLGVVQLTDGDFEKGVTASTLVAKTADSLPAFVGAISAALSDNPVTTPYWEERLSVLHGICIPSYKGKSFLGIVNGLASMAEATFISQKRQDR